MQDLEGGNDVSWPEGLASAISIGKQSYRAIWPLVTAVEGVSSAQALTTWVKRALSLLDDFQTMAKKKTSWSQPLCGDSLNIPAHWSQQKQQISGSQGILKGLLEAQSRFCSPKQFQLFLYSLYLYPGGLFYQHLNSDYHITYKQPCLTHCDILTLWNPNSMEALPFLKLFQ